LWEDDFGILAQSWTWQRTRAGIWVPQNEHAMPAGRLLTYGLVQLAGRPTGLPRATALLGPTSLVIGMLLLFVFVRRELGHSIYGLVAMTLFGVTSVYQQAVWWFAAAFVIPAVDTYLVGLLAAQSWRRERRYTSVVVIFLAAALSPTWFATGILAGPLIAVYLVPWRNTAMGPAQEGRLAAWVGPAAALAGTVVFLAVSLPFTAEAILHTSHYGEKTAIEAFDPVTGLVWTGRSIVDNLVFGISGVGGLPLAVPVFVVPAFLVALAALLWWWWRPVLRGGAAGKGARLLPLGLAMIGANYLLVYSARASWGYNVMTLLHWSRYHLLPQMGLALLVCGALPAWLERFEPRTADEALRRSDRLLKWQTWGVACLVGICFVVQLPRAMLSYFPLFPLPRLEALLRRIEEVENRCQKYHISAQEARLALGPLELTEWYGEVDGWDFLQGSAQPDVRPPEEVRRLLED
jgi:hypothetical protein